MSCVLYDEVHLLDNILTVNRRGVKITFSTQTLNKHELFKKTKLQGESSIRPMLIQEFMCAMCVLYDEGHLLDNILTVSTCRLSIT